MRRLVITLVASLVLANVIANVFANPSAAETARQSDPDTIGDEFLACIGAPPLQHATAASDRNSH